MKFSFLLCLITPLLFIACNENSNSSDYGSGAERSEFLEGKDYLLFERVRVKDHTAFTEPQDAYSLLLPKGWNHEGSIVWKAGGESCAGTYRTLKASSPNGKIRFQIFPDRTFSWNNDPMLRQFYQQQPAEELCGTAEPMDAETFLRQMLLPETGNITIITIENNQDAVSQMMANSENSRRELQQYGAGEIRFKPSAIHAQVEWPDGDKGWITAGVMQSEIMVPNHYNGTYSSIHTTAVSHITMFRYPAGEKENAEKQFSMIMASIRTNPGWSEAVNQYWRNVRQQKQVVHLGKIRMMDEQTRRIGEQAIRNGANRLREMDNQMKSWELKQASQDRMHTRFIKAIREVENYKDESGTYELSSSYNHAWSRGDGNVFIMTDDPNLDPSSIFRDQRWKEMKKAD